MARVKTLLITLIATISALTTVSAHAESGALVSVSITPTELGMKRIEIQSRADSIKVFDVEANRGNCSVDTAENAIGKALPGMGEYASQLAQLSGMTLKKKGDTLKFGQKILFMTDASCDIIELTVKTSEGNIKIETE